VALGLSAVGADAHTRAKRKTAVDTSLYTGPAPRPGPAILYAKPAVAPQLTNSGIWHAKPTLVSGTEAYRDGEFLYEDYLYDDHGAHEAVDPSNPMAADAGDLFSMPNGTYTYPTGAAYANNAADLVEFRVKPLAKATAFRITMNTLQNQALIAFSIAIGGTPAKTYQFPDGANVVAPASLFLTVRPVDGKLKAQLVRAGSDASVAGPAPSVKVDMYRRQIQVEVPHSEWNPRRSTVRFAMGVGLWNSATNRYLLPGAVATATTPGGAGTDTDPAAFFNVAFRTDEPLPSVEDSTNAVLDTAWWRDKDQGAALASGNISQLHAEVNFGKLSRRVTDNAMIPRTGELDMILSSHYSLGQGENFAHPCGLDGSPDAGGCSPEYLGQLEPYAIYIPSGPVPPGGYGLTLLLHSLSANYNQFSGSRDQSQFADRAHPSIVITPEARGPDQSYEGLGAADVFEVWAVVAHMYKLDPAYTDIAGYSMGGIGTFKLAEQFPDLFARAQPTVGAETGNNDLVASLRNVPVLMWNNVADELVGAELYEPTANALSSDGYRYQLDVYRPCASSLCSPLFPDHLELAVNDEYAPAAAFLGSATVDYDPAHVTYVAYPTRSVSKYELVADHAYWLSDLTLRSPTDSAGKAEAEIDASSHGFGVGNPTASSEQLGTGALTGGYMGPIQYLSFSKTWGPTPSAPVKDEIDITATNLATASINVARAHVDCHVVLNVTTDGPLTITLPGCNRVVHAS
jgi:pimeloyl-ACP methyl ester carboxylesterase